LLTGFREMLLV